MTQKLNSTYCHEIQIGLGITSVPDFENLTLIGRATRLALHIRGLSTISYDTLRLVAYHFLNIPTESVIKVLEVLGEIEFVKIYSEGKSIKTVTPTVPYYEELHKDLSSFGNECGFNESEELTLDILKRLSASPDKTESLINKIGCDRTLFTRVTDIGNCGNYFKAHKSRGQEVLISPNFFSENFDLYIDLVAQNGAHSIQRILELVKKYQGYPLSLIEKNKAINGEAVTEDDIKMLKRLAYEGAIKPPSITTKLRGENFFLFTPTPAGASIAPAKRDIYEKSMAIVSAIRLGQYLPSKYSIRSPGAVLYTLIRDKKLKRSNTEANQQYKNLVHLRIARLEQFSYGYAQLHIIDTEENMEALNMAYQLIDDGNVSGAEIDEDARKALQQPIKHTESLVAAGKFKKNAKVALSEQQRMDLDLVHYK